MMLAALALALVSAQECEEMQVTLLQSSIQLTKVPLNVSEPMSMVHRAGQELRRRLSLAYSLVLPTEKTLLSGIPALLVFMLAGLVMALLVVQLIGIYFDRREPSQQFGVPKPGYSTGGTLPPMSLPPSRASLQGRPSNGTASAPSTVGAVPGRDGAMCPALIVPYAEANFCVAQQGMQGLREGLQQEVPPVPVLGGQTGKALLYARFKTVKDAGLANHSRHLKTMF